MVKSGLELFILKFTEPLKELLLPSAKISPVCQWISKKKSRIFFTVIFKLENGNFKTRVDFSPLIERVLAGV